MVVSEVTCIFAFQRDKNDLGINCILFLLYLSNKAHNVVLLMQHISWSYHVHAYVQTLTQHNYLNTVYRF